MRSVALAFTVFVLFSFGAFADEGHHHEDLTQEHSALLGIVRSSRAEALRTGHRAAALVLV
jgi:hypothetical protein